MEPLDYWRLCDELTINQAALLIAGVDPAIFTKINSLAPRERPTGFDAAICGYGRVMILFLDGVRWMVVGYDNSAKKPVLSRELRLSDAAGF